MGVKQMNKKIIAAIIVVIIIALCAYQFVYVPYQNEEAIKNYNAGLQNISAIDGEINESLAKLDNLNPYDISGGINVTTQTFKEVEPKIDQQLEKLNETRTYANGNETKEKYIDYQIKVKEIEKELVSETIKEYEEFNTAYANSDINKMMSVSTDMEKSYNSKTDEVKPVRDDIINLLNEHPDLNQTLHDLNLSDDFYGNMTLSHI